MNQDSDLLAIYFLNHKPAPPIKVNIEVNGFVVPMEVDTGALTSLLLIGIPSKRSILVHSSFYCQQNAGNKHSGEIVLPKSVVEVEFSYKGKMFEPNFLSPVMNIQMYWVRCV